jgi:hypothetical protein
VLQQVGDSGDVVLNVLSGNADRYARPSGPLRGAEVTVKLETRPLRCLLVPVLAPLILGAVSLPNADAPPVQGQGKKQGQLVLRNVAWESVRIDVRIGKASNCEMNSPVGEKALRKGRVWAISSDLPICWRRELAPNGRASGGWTPWTRRIITPGKVEKATP